MASEDVIELGSSDEEVNPAPKTMKSVPNAMVNIPSGISGLTIKPAWVNPKVSKQTVFIKAQSSKPPLKPKGVGNKKLKAGGTYAMQKPIPIVKQSSDTKNKVWPVLQNNAGPLPININSYNASVSSMKQNQFTNMKVNPLSALYNNKNVIVKKAPSAKSIPKLPPGITIKSTNAATGVIKRNPQIVKRCLPLVLPVIPVLKKPRFNHTSKVGDVLTVEIDDEETSNSTGNSNSPQWYVKPEDLVASSMEKINNKEPTKLIEITVEDSPNKAIPNKRKFDALNSSTITIEDSPIKPKKMKEEMDNEKLDSGQDADSKKNIGSKSPGSKKQLQYTKTEDDCNKKNVSKAIVKGELKTNEDVLDSSNLDSKIKSNEKTSCSQVDVVIEIEESPFKESNDECIESTKQIPKKPNFDDKNKENEFHPIYQRFIDLCFELENSEDMKKIVEKKIKAYYKQVPKEYTKSEEFLEMVSSKSLAMKSGSDKMYLYIKDIVDELNLQRKIAKSQPVVEDTKVTEPEPSFYGKELEQDSKRRRQIRKLEKTIKKLHRAIQKLEDQEVDFDDEGDSVYILTERYKERLVRVHTKLCQLSRTKMPSEPKVQLQARPGQPEGPAKRLEKMINKKVPMGTPLPFPDFHDVLRCVREANDEDRLRWNEVDIMEEARDLFVRCGRKLQRRRQENEWRLAASRISNDCTTDPADNSEELQDKLQQNKKAAAQKESEVINKYADKQRQLKLEGEEIGDKEANESPSESGDEEQDEMVDDEYSLENSEDRKERLKRLLKEKSRSNSDTNSNDKIDNSDKKSDDGKSDDKKLETIIEKDNEEKISDNDQHSKKELPKDKERLIKPKEITVHEQTGGKELVTSHEPHIEKDKISSSESVIETEVNRDQVKEHAKPIDEAKMSICKENDEVNSDNKITDAKNEEIKEAKVLGNEDCIHSLSDNSNDLDSDIDELHLLQKLHSENEVISSSADSSDMGTIIATDTLDSDDDVDSQQPCSDVISIENSSYSESEYTKDESFDNNKITFKDNSLDKATTIKVKLEYESPKKLSQTSNEEYNEPIGDILLASSDEELDLRSEKQNSEIKGSLDKSDCLKETSVSKLVIESIVEDTIVEDTIVEDAIVEDTILEETIPEDTILEDTIPEDTILEESTYLDQGPSSSETVQDVNDDDGSQEKFEINSISSSEVLLENTTDKVEDINLDETKDNSDKEEEITSKVISETPEPIHIDLNNEIDDQDKVEINSISSSEVVLEEQLDDNINKEIVNSENDFISQDSDQVVSKAEVRPKIDEILCETPEGSADETSSQENIEINSISSSETLLEENVDNDSPATDCVKSSGDNINKLLS